MAYNFEDFLNDYGAQLSKIKTILGYLHTYPELLAKLNFDFLKPEDLDNRQEDWVRLVSQYDGLEKDFFKPYWVPIGRKQLDIFIDLSDSEFPLFEMEFFFFEPYHYFKTFLFYKMSDLLLAPENNINFKEFEEQRIASILCQSDIYFEMRKNLGLLDRPMS
jgi:hypothetical protein